MGVESSNVRPGHTAGSMRIELENNIISFSAGQIIRGQVRVSQKDHFQASGLSVGLYGEEYASWLYIYRANKSTHYNRIRGWFPIVDANFMIAQCPNNVAVPGEFTFPFSIQIPDWLPSSFLTAKPEWSNW